MPLFFFHYHTPDESTLDDVGCNFASLDLAYLDAYRSMIEIGAEALKDQIDPSAHRIEIADRDGLVLMELHFDDIFRVRKRLPDMHDQRLALHRNMQNIQRLRDNIHSLCSSTRLSLAKAQETLRRARATTPWI